MADEKEENQEEKELSPAEKAAKEIEEKEKDEPTEEESKESSEEEKETAEEEESEEESVEEDSEAAVNLLRALKDPTIGPAMIKKLAEDAGFKIEGASKTEQKSIIDSIDDLVKAELGPDFTIFADKLTKILKKVVPAVAEESQKQLKEQFADSERNRVRNEVKNAMESVFDSYENIPNTVKKELSRLMDEMPPTPGKTDPHKYFKRMVTLAANEVGVTLKSKNGDSTNNKRERNQRDATSRLASDRAAEASNEGKSGPRQFKSRADAISQAVKDVEKQLAKK